MGFSFIMKNQIRNIFFLVTATVIISCGNGGKDISKEIIPEEDMVKIFTEIELTQALIKLKFSNQDTINQQELFNQVYKDFNISEDQFNKSLVYYCEKPKVLEEMYVKVINNLSVKQAEIQ